MLHVCYVYISFIAADDETSFDPNDITFDPDDIIDEGWWVSEVNGQRGSFPANTWS